MVTDVHEPLPSGCAEEPEKTPHIGAILPRADVPTMATQTVVLQNTEDLREATHGADLKVVQLASGSFGGRLTHAQIGSVSLSAGDFEPDIRARGVMNPDMVTLGMMVDSSGDVMQWDYHVEPGDIIVFPRSVEQEGRFTGRSRYLTLTLTEDELARHTTGERELQDPRFWTEIKRFRPSPGLRAFIRKNLDHKIAQLREGTLTSPGAATEHFRRSLLEAFIVGILDAQDAGAEGREHHTASRLVRAVEDYVDGIGPDQPIHISELCLALGVSRRSLHRAFHETLDVGPVEYLRLRRLSSVRRVLSSMEVVPKSVTRAALDAGFTDFGRFAGYYKRIFRETPSQTRKHAMARRREPDQWKPGQ